MLTLLPAGALAADAPGAETARTLIFALPGLSSVGAAPAWGLALESHMIGVEPWNTCRPVASVADRPPSGAALKFSPAAVAVIRNCASAGLVAAVASCTTRISL